MIEVPISFLDRQVSPFSPGTRKRSFLAGGEVAKIAYRDNLHREANLHQQMLQHEYNLLFTYLSPDIAKSDFRVELGTRGSYFVTEWQPLYRGVSMQMALDLLPQANQRHAVSNFLEKCVSMYTSTRKLPDIFGRILGVGFYNVLDSPNVIATFSRDLEAYQPILVDTQINRLNKVILVGKVNTLLLFLGIKHAQKLIGN